MQRFHHDCVRTMLRINWHQQWKRKIKMKQLFAELGNCVRPLRWHYETRHLRWVGHIARMKHDRLPLMLLTSWVPHSRPIGCPRMTFGRTVKKALKRREEIWPGLPFDRLARQLDCPGRRSNFLLSTRLLKKSKVATVPRHPREAIQFPISHRSQLNPPT